MARSLFPIVSCPLATSNSCRKANCACKHSPSPALMRSLLNLDSVFKSASTSWEVTLFTKEQPSTCWCPISAHLHPLRNLGRSYFWPHFPKKENNVQGSGICPQAQSLGTTVAGDAMAGVGDLSTDPGSVSSAADATISALASSCGLDSGRLAWGKEA